MEVPYGDILNLPYLNTPNHKKRTFLKLMDITSIRSTFKVVVQHQSIILYCRSFHCNCTPTVASNFYKNTDGTPNRQRVVVTMTSPIIDVLSAVAEIDTMYKESGDTVVTSTELVATRNTKQPLLANTHLAMAPTHTFGR